MNQRKHLEVKILQFYLHIKAAKYITMKPEEKKKKNIFFLSKPFQEWDCNCNWKKSRKAFTVARDETTIGNNFFCASKTAFTQCKITKRKREKQTIISKISKDN